MTWQQRVLSGVAHPQIAYLLLTLGTLGLTIELWSPGAMLPGVAGGICLLLAFFAFQVLPVSYAGVLLILFGLALLVLEVKVTSFGLLAVGGIVSLLFGSMMLIDSPLPEMQIGLRLIVPVDARDRRRSCCFSSRLAVQRAAYAAGHRAIAGCSANSAQALTAIEPGRHGQRRDARRDLDAPRRRADRSRRPRAGDRGRWAASARRSGRTSTRFGSKRRRSKANARIPSP